jgi:hypothetical protein
MDIPTRKAYKCQISTSLIIREENITIIRHYYTPIRMAKMTKTGHTKH